MNTRTEIVTRMPRARDHFPIARDTNATITLQQVAPVSLGWLDGYLTRLASTRRYVCSLLDPIVVTMLGTAVVNSMYDDRNDLINAAINVTQGSAAKAYNVSLMPAGGGDLTVNLTPASTRSFGVKVTVGDSVNGLKAGGYPISLIDNSTGTTLYQVLVEVPAGYNSFDLLMLSAVSNGGLASIIPLIDPEILVVGPVNGSAAVASQTNVTTQSLNQRDLGIGLQM